MTETETELWKEPPDPILEAIARLATAESPEWSGSASELAERLNIDLQPNVLTRKLNIGADRLWNEYHIRYEASRSHTGRIVKLTLDES